MKIGHTRLYLGLGLQGHVHWGVRGESGCAPGGGWHSQQTKFGLWAGLRPAAYMPLWGCGVRSQVWKVSIERLKKKMPENLLRAPQVSYQTKKHKKCKWSTQKVFLCPAAILCGILCSSKLHMVQYLKAQLMFRFLLIKSFQCRPLHFV